jgi:NAD(P)-dependent dehydrogenase (short-subunit alcohol dehydrogenase family)
MKIQNKVYVITGGGNGMGRELALQLLFSGAKVAAVDIDQEGLGETAELAGENSTRLSHTSWISRIGRQCRNCPRPSFQNGGLWMA